MADQRQPAIVRPRALVAGCLLVPLIVWVSQTLEVVGNYPGLAQGPYTSNYLLPFPVLLTVLLLMGANWAARRRKKEALLWPAELLLVYAMMAVGITAGSSMFGAGVLQVMGIVPHFAPAPGAADPTYDLLSPLLPRHLTVTDQRILDPLYQGGGWPDLGVAAAGLGPLLLLWTAFIVLLCLLLYAAATIFARQWSQAERLAYPVAMIPLTIVQSGKTLTQSKLFWLGILIPVALHTTNGLTRLFPVVPPLKVVHYADYLTQGRPWSSAWPIIFQLSLTTIGIGFFVPTDVLFSAWFFVWVVKAALTITNALGFGEPNIYAGAPYATEHSYGSFLALAVYTGWLARRQLGELVRRPGLWGVGRGTIAFLLGGSAAAAAFVHYLLGLPWWAAALFVVLFIAFSTALGRLRAQAAPPDAGLTIGQADAVMKVALGPHVLGPKSIVGLSLYLNSFTRWGMRNPIGGMADGLRLRGEKGGGPWGVAIPAALLVAVPSGLLITLSLYFKYGLAHQAFYWQGASGGWMRDDAVAQLTSTERWQAGPLIGVISGFFITWGLAALRSQFVGFPLHPIGFAISAGYGMHQVWFSVFLVWALKAALVRWGGLRAWRGAVPFFIGLIIGEAVMMAAWAGINAGVGTKYYTCTE